MSMDAMLMLVQTLVCDSWPNRCVYNKSV